MEQVQQQPRHPATQSGWEALLALLKTAHSCRMPTLGKRITFSVPRPLPHGPHLNHAVRVNVNMNMNPARPPATLVDC